MSWLLEFMTEAIDSYRKLNKAELVGGTFEEKVDAILAEKVIHATFIGYVGERHVTETVKSKGYDAIRSLGSRSPADVWGFRITEGVSHLPLVQVKTTRKGTAPETLSAKDERRLTNFSLFVADLFLKSTKVPQDAKKYPLIVSTGYAGIVVEPNEMRATEIDTRFISASSTKEIYNDWARWGEWLDEFYKTLRP